MFHLYSISDQFVYWKLSPDPNLDSKRKFNFTVKALNLLANLPSPTHSKTPCQIPLSIGLKQQLNLAGISFCKQHRHRAAPAFLYSCKYVTFQRPTDADRWTGKREEKKAFLEITSNVLYVQLWLLVGLTRLFLEGKTLPACNVLLHALSKQATTPDFFPPHLLKW